ncbi:MAG TPA: hypothetical protein VMI32_21725 [Candidatus Solibacter sp.]|nr:hypothetical protein [Candidatus Solibacter sp.]
MAGTVLSRLLGRQESGAGQTSPTPILDLIEPLPKPTDMIVTGKFAAPFISFIALVVVTQNYAFLLVLLGILPALFLAVAIHESGHLFFGWCAGLRFRGVEIAPLCVMRIRGKWSLRLRPRIYAGAAHMKLGRVRRIRRQLVVCTLGGPVSSYTFAFVTFLVGEIYRLTDSFGWTTFLEFSGFLSLFIAVFSTFPYRARVGGNDAFLLRQLLFSKSGSIHMIASHAAYFAGSVEPILPPYFERWWKLASAQPGSFYPSYHINWNAYRAAKDPAVAAGYLEELLRESPSHDIETRNFLAAEAAFFTARHRPATDQCSVWIRRAGHLEWLGPLSRIRLDVALAESRQQFAKALAICDSGLALIRANLNGPSSLKLESEWLDWKRQIEERVAPETTDMLQPC